MEYLYQKDKSALSTEEYAIYRGSVPHLYDFTFCFWEYSMFQNIKSSCPFTLMYETGGPAYSVQLWWKVFGESMGTQVRATINQRFASPKS